MKKKGQAVKRYFSICLNWQLHGFHCPVAPIPSNLSKNIKKGPKAMTEHYITLAQEPHRIHVEIEVIGQGQRLDKFNYSVLASPFY